MGGGGVGLIWGMGRYLGCTLVSDGLGIHRVFAACWFRS